MLERGSFCISLCSPHWRQPKPLPSVQSDWFPVLQLSPLRWASTWMVIRAPSLHCSWHREHIARPWQCMADSADSEVSVLLDHNRCISWTVSRQISSRHGLMPKQQKLKNKKSEHLLACATHALTGRAVLPAICLYFISVQISATATNHWQHRPSSPPAFQNCSFSKGHTQLRRETETLRSAVVPCGNGNMGVEE